MESHKQIVDQFNQPITSYKKGIAKAARRNFLNPSHQKADIPFDELFPTRDQRELLNAARTLYSNCSLVAASINQKASYCVATGYNPLFHGDDVVWGDAAIAWLNKWYRRCDTKGDAFGFKKNLELASISIDRDGDAFILLTKSKTGYPLLQTIPAHKVGNRNDQITVGGNSRYKNLKIVNGVILNKFSRPVAYQILGAKETDDVIVPSNSMIHAYDPKWMDQSRGITSLSTAIDTYKNLSKSTEFELLAQSIQSQMTIAVQTETGTGDVSNLYDNQPAGDVSMENIEGGKILYVDSNGNGKIDMLQPSARPSGEWQAFHKKLSTEAVASMGWSLPIILQSEGSGTATRSEIAKCEKSIEHRQEILTNIAKRMVVYAISCAIERDDLKASKDFDKFSFSKTRKLSIDIGRDSAARINEYNAGLQNLEDLVGDEGKDWRQHVTNAHEEQAFIELDRRRIEDKYKVKIDPRTVRLLTPNEKPNDE